MHDISNSFIAQPLMRESLLESMGNDAPLGWLNAADFIEEHAVGLMHWASSLIQERDIDRVVLLGMGGSSQAAEAIYSIFGRQAGFPELLILDTTSPSELQEFEINTQTLFIVSSKSGKTIETADLLAWLYHRAESLQGPPCTRFVAITDPGSDLAIKADSEGFLKVFLNPPDIVGRFSALSYFAMVPAALLGVDLVRLGRQLKQRWSSCQAGQSSELPGLVEVMNACSKSGYGVLGIDLEPSLLPLFTWIEQLVAESTGKQAKGILPVDPQTVNRRLLDADGYGVASIRINDAKTSCQKDPNTRTPFVIAMRDDYDLGWVFMLWMAATAIVACRLGINAFDQPDVEAAKRETLRVVQGDKLNHQQARSSLENQEFSNLTISFDTQSPAASKRMLEQFCAQAKPGGYLAILAYLPNRPAVEASLKKLADAFKSRFGAVTIGFGPRYLHSTGQLHKGGPPIGCYLQIVEEDEIVLDIPGRNYGFSRLHRAQADGDFMVLNRHQRPIVRMLIRGNRLAELDRLTQLLA